MQVMLDAFDAVFRLEVIQEPKHCVLQQLRRCQAPCSWSQQLRKTAVLAERLVTCVYVT